MLMLSKWAGMCEERAGGEKNLANFPENQGNEEST
jgi:hypothetical protein